MAIGVTAITRPPMDFVLHEILFIPSKNKIIWISLAPPCDDFDFLTIGTWTSFRTGYFLKRFGFWASFCWVLRNHISIVDIGTLEESPLANDEQKLNKFSAIFLTMLDASIDTAEILFLRMEIQKVNFYGKIFWLISRGEVLSF